MNQKEKKKIFIRYLAEYLNENAGMKSIELEMKKPYILEWAKLRRASPILGYMTTDEAEKILTEFLS